MKWRKKFINIRDFVGKEYNVVFKYEDETLTSDPSYFNEFYNYEEN